MVAVTQLGYLGIGVQNLHAWAHFASQTLGLQINGRDEGGAMFLKMDEYHHRFAVYPKGNDDVLYVGWEVADEHALQALRGQLQAAGVSVTPGLAALAAERRVVYLITCADPNGVATVEYGWGARVVDDATWQVQQHTRGSIWGHRPQVSQPVAAPAVATPA